MNSFQTNQKLEMLKEIRQLVWNEINSNKKSNWSEKPLVRSNEQFSKSEKPMEHIKSKQWKNIPRRLASIQSTRKNSQKQKQKAIHLDPSFYQMSELRKSLGLLLLKFNIIHPIFWPMKGYNPLVLYRTKIQLETRCNTGHTSMVTTLQ
jgi:hypothetical protein